ncbi:MAG: NADH-quinone oxidoreductase subunit M [Acidobacteria bacterium]|nr:MAG: NADH-quinone oxidoreductase subunit M [Acidobacteriota bacterium]
MTFLNHTIVSWIIFFPMIGIVALLLTRGEQAIKRVALVFTVITFALSLHLPFHWNSAEGGFQFLQAKSWIPAFGIHYLVGADGLSLWLMVLTTFLSVLGVLVSWKSVKQNLKAFFILLLLLECGMLGVFSSIDLFLFYVFWEVTLVPMAFLIGIWGHERRIYAAVKFFLYTMAGSLLMLGCILWLYNLTGTFNYMTIKAGLANGLYHLSPTTELVLFLGFFVAFAIKVPLFPFHTWLPDAHTEAPTAGSVLLAGVLLKMGPYGMLRFNLELFPHAARTCASWIVILGLIGIIYGALVAFSQPNMKKLVAYSSVSHMGFIMVGVFTFSLIGTQGAIYQMLNHGISTGGLFILVGMLYERRHTFDLKEYGGIAKVMPLYAGFFIWIVMSSVGLPLLNGFVGEFMIMLGTFTASVAHAHVFGIVACVGIIVGAMYLLHWTRSTVWGEITNAKNNVLAKLDKREIFVLTCIAVLTLFMGVASPFFLNKTVASSQLLVASVNAPSARTRSGVTAALTTSHQPVTTVRGGGQ